MAQKNSRKYRCADCGSFQMEHPVVMARRCKPRCKGCGSTFLDPYSEGAVDQFVTTGHAKAVLDPKGDGNRPPMDGRENVKMQD